jgi:hypothetical protein
MPRRCKEFAAHLGDIAGDSLAWITDTMCRPAQDESCSGLDQPLARRGSRFSLVLGVGQIELHFRSRLVQVKPDMASSIAIFLAATLPLGVLKARCALGLTWREIAEKLGAGSPVFYNGAPLGTP